MKPFFALLLVIVSAIQQSAAQVTTAAEMVEREERVFKGGIITGLNFCQVDGDTYAGYGKVGLHAGAVVSIRLGKVFNINTELLHTRKGTRGAHVKSSMYAGTYFDKYYLDLNYIELPVVLQFKRALLWGLEGGLAYGRLISSKEQGFTYVPIIIDPEINRFNENELSTVFGGYYFVNKHLVASLRFQYSASSIRPWQRVPEQYTMFRNQKNNVITLRLVYMF